MSVYLWLVALQFVFVQKVEATTAEWLDLGQSLVMIIASEFAVDWIKHAFVTKFNRISPNVPNAAHGSHAVPISLATAVPVCTRPHCGVLLCIVCVVQVSASTSAEASCASSISHATRRRWRATCGRSVPRMPSRGVRRLTSSPTRRISSAVCCCGDE